jgi:chromosome partitioning protein
MIRVFAFANQKGGVAKTTTVSNLASEMASRGARILMIDIDPQSSLSMTFERRVHEAQSDRYLWVKDLLMSDAPVDINKAIVRVHETYPLYLIPSGILLSEAEIGLVLKDAREQRLKSALAKLADQYDYVFIDCPPNLNFLTINALVAADFVIIPVECEFYGLDGISLLIRTIDRIKGNEFMNPDLLIGGVVVTKFDKRKNMHNEALEMIQNFDRFRGLVFNPIPTNSTVAEASSRTAGYAAALDRSCAGAIAFNELASRFLKRFPLLNDNKEVKNG